MLKATDKDNSSFDGLSSMSTYRMSKKSCPILYSNLQYEMDKDFLDIQYNLGQVLKEGRRTARIQSG